jgi:hypothetical protein
VLVHGRRRLVDAARAGDLLAFEGLRIISQLFAVERISTLAGDSAEQRRERRQQVIQHWPAQKAPMHPMALLQSRLHGSSPSGRQPLTHEQRLSVLHGLVQTQ